MKRALILLLGSGLFLFGCSEEKKTVENYGTTVIKQADRAREAQSQAQLQVLRSAVASFKALEGRSPNSLEELVEKRVLNQIPAAPPGKRFVYNAENGDVKIE